MKKLLFCIIILGLLSCGNRSYQKSIFGKGRLNDCERKVKPYKRFRA